MLFKTLFLKIIKLQNVEKKKYYIRHIERIKNRHLYSVRRDILFYFFCGETVVRLIEVPNVFNYFYSIRLYFVQ